MPSEKQVTSDNSSSFSTSTISSLRALLNKKDKEPSPPKSKRQPIQMSEEQRRTEAEARAAYFSLR